MPDDMTAKKPMAGGNDAEENKLWAVIGYFGLLCLIPLLAKKDSAFAQYHAKQGLVLTIVAFVLGFIPFVNLLAWIVTLILFIIGIMNALNGKMAPLPVIGQYADKINI